MHYLEATHFAPRRGRLSERTRWEGGEDGGAIFRCWLAAALFWSDDGGRFGGSVDGRVKNLRWIFLKGVCREFSLGEWGFSTGGNNGGENSSLRGFL